MHVRTIWCSRFRHTFWDGCHQVLWRTGLDAGSCVASSATSRWRTPPSHRGPASAFSRCHYIIQDLVVPQPSKLATKPYMYGWHLSWDLLDVCAGASSCMKITADIPSPIYLRKTGPILAERPRARDRVLSDISAMKYSVCFRGRKWISHTPWLLITFYTVIFRRLLTALVVRTACFAWSPDDDFTDSRGARSRRQACHPWWPARNSPLAIFPPFWRNTTCFGLLVVYFELKWVFQELGTQSALKTRQTDNF